MEKLSYYYRMLFFQACARRSDKHKSVGELASGAYWVISAMEGVNLLAIIYFVSWLVEGKAINIVLVTAFLIPLLINYFIFMKNEKYKEILKDFSKYGVGKTNLKSYGLILGYIVFTLIFLALTGFIYQYK